MLTGPIPAELGALTQLRYLHLYNNMLTGPIPAEFCLSPNLDDVRLSNNSLNGSIPICLATTPSIVLLDHNQFSGSVYINTAVACNIEYFFASHNRLTGQLTNLDHLSALIWLDLQANLLTGPLPSPLPESLFMLELSANQFTGVIPAAWTNHSARRLGLAFNQLFAQSPLSVSLPYVGVVDLSGNPFQAVKVKAEFVQLANPGFLNTSSSLIPCPYPESLSDSVVDTEITTLLWVREPCVLEWELYWVLMITTVGLGMVVLGVWLLWGRNAQERQWTNWHALGGCLVWVVVATPRFRLSVCP
jgi:hypothetical protein